MTALAATAGALLTAGATFLGSYIQSERASDIASRAQVEHSIDVRRDLYTAFLELDGLVRTRYYAQGFGQVHGKPPTPFEAQRPDPEVSSMGTLTLQMRLTSSPAVVDAAFELARNNTNWLGQLSRLDQPYLQNDLDRDLKYHDYVSNKFLYAARDEITAR